VNIHEERAWKVLIELGAREFMLFNKHALDLSPIRATTKNKLCLLVNAVIGVIGRSGANRRHMDRRGLLIYVVTDYYTVGRPNDRDRHDPENRAFAERKKREKESKRT
jgi:hypothetical protein